MGEFDWKELVGNLLLFGLVFGMSATVDIECLKAQLKNKKAIATGIFLQFIILPFLGFLIVNLLDLDHAMGITLLVVTSSPGGSYSNWWCSMFNADLALSVTMTAVSTLLSVIMLPANLLFYSKFSYEDDILSFLDWPSLFMALILVISAIALGLFCSAKIHSHKFNMLANKVGNLAGIALVVFSATMANTGSGDTKMWARDWNFYVGVALPCILGLLVANILCLAIHLLKPECVTVSVECCYQNTGIATSIALAMFDGDELSEAIGVPFFYGLVEAVLLAVYCIVAWKAGWSKAPKDEKIWTVILTSYEVVNAEKKELDSIEINISESDQETPDEEQSEHGDMITSYFAMATGLDDDKHKGKKEPSGLADES